MTGPDGRPGDPGALHLPRGSTTAGDLETVVDPGGRPGWTHTGLRVLALVPGRPVRVDREGVETMVVPLSGACEVTVGGVVHALRGRADVFAGPTDVLYLPVGAGAELVSAAGARIALAAAAVAPDRPRHPVALIRAEDVPVEVRGGGSMTRHVRNFGTVGSFDACDSLIACEVITPGGHWSSYPAHKHDETVTDGGHRESELEEIYYYEIQDGPGGTPGFGFHRTTGSDPARPLDVLCEVRDRDTVLVPHGWHGPCVAAPGHDMYYLNVMAGPGEDRAWDITDHPDQTWVRGTWDTAGGPR